jgi:hypothetical protein
VWRVRPGLYPERAHPRQAARGGGKLPRLILQVTLQQLVRTGVSEELRGAPHFNVSAGQDRDRGSTLLDPFGQAMGVLGPLCLGEKRMKVLREPVVKREGRLTPGAPWLVARSELDAIGREAIAEERQTGALGGIDVIEHGQQDCAHVCLLTVKPVSAPGVLRFEDKLYARCFRPG